jgi:hypothetical protein
MPYWKSKSQNLRTLDSFSLATNQSVSDGGKQAEFYEMELGVVLDIILDEDHAIFSQGTKLHSLIDADRWPENVKREKSSPQDKDLSWIGRALVRPIISNQTCEKSKLTWAFPLEGNISEYPLLNETVILVQYNEKLFYSRKVNLRNWTNNNADFGIEKTTSGTENTELFKTPTAPYQGPKSITRFQGGKNYEGAAGRYFIANNRIRTLKRYEGDLLMESRFGQSIHMTTYDSNRTNDVGYSKNKDYSSGGGNPMILIRNRQRPLIKEGDKIELTNSPNLATLNGTPQEKNVGGYVDENVNHDGSSIHITSGLTISQWVTTCHKKMFGNGEEVTSFNGTSNFKYPELSGDQIVISSDRLIFSSRYGETFHYSKKRYGVVTDDEFTLDAHNQTILTTNTKTVINSPAIYLGEYDVTGEPALLGQTTVNWMYDLCNWILDHTHWYIHAHVDAGKESPSQTQLSVQRQQLIALRDNLHKNLSRRVFLTGGGFAPGKNGGSIENGSNPTNINIGNGSGVPGGWTGANKR